jgi:hypothetical protein
MLETAASLWAPIASADGSLKFGPLAVDAPAGDGVLGTFTGVDLGAGAGAVGADGVCTGGGAGVAGAFAGVEDELWDVAFGCPGV